MKAVFKRYLGSLTPDQNGVYLTVGKIYDLIPSEVVEGFYNVEDDNGFVRLIRPNIVYEFEFLNKEEFLMDDILCNQKLGIAESNGKLKHYVNGIYVTKERFDDVLSCVKYFEAEGVDTSSIKFELRFE